MVLFLSHGKINSIIEQCHTFFYKRSSFNERNRLHKWKTLLIIITGKLDNYRKHPFVVVFQNGPFKKGVLKNFATQVFSCEYCGIFKYSFFNRTPLMAASEL